jgi:hypothetical protein
MSERSTKRVQDAPPGIAQSLLTTREAGQRLGAPERTIRRAIARAMLPAEKQAGAYPIEPEALQRLGPPRSIPRVISLPRPHDGMTPLPTPLTLTGPGGIGKSRLAIAAASSVHADFPVGVAFVNLAPVARAELVLPAIAGALGIQEPVRHGPREQRAIAFLRGQRRLLLDNCEHLPGAAPPTPSGAFAWRCRKDGQVGACSRSDACWEETARG